jgi:hypothetical protein
MSLRGIQARGSSLLNQKRSTTGFSLRINDEWLKTLREESNRQGISVNALMNKILENYCHNWRWAERFGVIIMNSPTFAEIICCCPDESLQEIAKVSGSTRAKDALRTIGVPPTYDQLILFIRNNLGKFGNWFDYNQYSRGRKELIHLRHEMGRKWSIFVANQVSTMFESILDKTAKTEIFDNAATLEIVM